MGTPEHIDDPDHSEPTLPEGDAPARPDWLVGADEGAEAERHRGQKDASEHVRLVIPANGAKPTPAKPEKPKPWRAAASSIPSLRPEEEDLPRPAPRAATPATPVARKAGFEAPPLDLRSLPGASGRPSARTARIQSPNESVKPMFENPAWAEDAAPEAEDPFAAVDAPFAPPGEPTGEALGPGARARAPLKPRRDAWYAVAIDEIRGNRTIHLGLALTALALALYVFWPRSTPSLPIATIHKHPERFDGESVLVRGRVGQVFTLGGGYAFYLHDGKDTLVVFTRVRVPVSRERITVSGLVSLGYLDGVARPAIFEAVP